MSEQSPTVYGGRYELHRRIARGGMADVFLARDQLLGRPVAIKVLFAEYANDQTFVERFRREAQSAANLNHPNIVAIYDWGEEAGTYYIVMEYVEGQSLAQILRREGRLSPEQVTRIGLDVSSALGFAHEGGVVHRDIKPGNVLVSPKGEMKVADFGIAQALSAGVEANLTQTGSVMGTATYFSPEQAQGLKVDERTDLYSLGVLMYEMLIGSPPFSGETPVAIAYKHVTEPCPPVTSHGIDIPAPLAAIITKLLAKDPSHRYHSAAALHKDLDRFRQGHAVSNYHYDPSAAGAGTANNPNMTAALPAHGSQVHRPAMATSYVEPPRRTGSVLAGILVLVLLLGGFVVLAKTLIDSGQLGGGQQTPTETPLQAVSVVDVVGASEQDAVNAMDQLGLLTQIDRVPSDSVAAGVVIRSEPSSGFMALLGSTVRLVISAGRGRAAVPSLLTMTENKALDAIVEAGFKPDLRRVASDRAPEGEVISQYPNAGTMHEVGEPVTIEVSAGVESKPVPEVEGLQIDQAIALLTEAGFEVNNQYEVRFDLDIPANAVIESDPRAGTPLSAGSTISLVVSNGRENAVLGNYRGWSQDQTVAELQNLGMNVLVQSISTSDPAQHGLVQYTVPAGGSPVTQGTEVIVYVGYLLVDAQPTTVGGFDVDPDFDPNAGQGN